MNGEFNEIYKNISNVISPYLEALKEDIGEIRKIIGKMETDMSNHNEGSAKHRLCTEKRLSELEGSNKWVTWAVRIMYGGLITVLVGFIATK